MEIVILLGCLRPPHVRKNTNRKKAVVLDSRDICGSVALQHTYTRSYTHIPGMLVKKSRKLFSFCRIIGFTLEFRMHINTLISFFSSLLCSALLHINVISRTAVSLHYLCTFGSFSVLCGHGTHAVLLCAEKNSRCLLNK